MRLTLDDSGQRFIVRGFTANSVRINQDELTRSFLLTPAQLIQDVPLHSVTAMQSDNLDWLYADAPEVLIIGTGAQTIRAQAAVQAAVLRAGIGLEFMDTGAACRTYTVLASELRRVSLLILFPESNIASI